MQVQDPHLFGFLVRVHTSNGSGECLFTSFNKHLNKHDPNGTSQWPIFTVPKYARARAKEENWDATGILPLCYPWLLINFVILGCWLALLSLNGAWFLSWKNTCFSLFSQISSNLGCLCTWQRFCCLELSVSLWFSQCSRGTTLRWAFVNSARSKCPAQIHPR